MEDIIVDFPTRKKSTLDLMLTNRPTFLSKCSPVSGFGDHDTAALVDMFFSPSASQTYLRKFHVGTELTLQHSVIK